MRRLVPLFTAFLFCSPGVFSQLLNGRVMTESGDDAAGVSVRFHNRANAITTNRDGTFKIMATKLPDTLIFSAAGYESYKVVITEKNIKDPHFEVVLLNTRKAMDEVVVTGLGSTRKKEVAYTATTFSGEELAGRASGLEVTESKSAPIRIRGTASGKGGIRPPADKDLDGYFDAYDTDLGRLKFFFADTNIAPRTGAAPPNQEYSPQER